LFVHIVVIDSLTFAVDLFVIIEVLSDLTNLCVYDLTENVDVDFVLRIINLVSIERSIVTISVVD
jgi:hypothetical protein